MQYVVTVLSWAGWTWTACFFAALVPLLCLQKHRRQRGFEVSCERQPN